MIVAYIIFMISKTASNNMRLTDSEEKEDE